MKKLIAFIISSSMISKSQAQQPLYQSSAFSIYNDKVVQGKYEAKAVAANLITSNYESPANLSQSSDISFKFAINGKDNEMPSGQDHHFSVEAVSGFAETPVIVFGKQLNQKSVKTAYIKPYTRLKVKLDMREVLKQFEEKGFYTAFNGTKIYKEDFKGVYVAGSILPMTWDFDNLVNSKPLQLKDDDKDGIYETDLFLNAKQDQKQTATIWRQLKDLNTFPQYKTPYLISAALYNMSLEEMIKAVEPDSTFRTGKEWSGVWTRDISYSIILSMAYLQPKVAMNSLLKKVNKKKKIIQDTGTGGAYPCSTDRMIWATAAWEVYKATGDKDWLMLAFEIIKNSIDDDQKNAYDPVTGLVKGESSFLDWRDQTYPKWMQPADIFESECLGTNAVHYQANIVLSEMSSVLNLKSVALEYAGIALKIKDGINKYLWMPEKGYYAQFLYGRNYKMVSPRSEALGEALCILFGIADAVRAKQIIASVPVTDYGITCIYPQIPGLPPYHNNAVWPFVQTYWTMAAAKVANENSVFESINDIYRPAALFLTNKENYVADNGDFAGTVINSSNMLWSLSGNLALVHKVFFGIEFSSDRLLFHPFIPAGFKGSHKLTNFKYRGAVLNIELEGYGNKITAFSLDGKVQNVAEFPASLTGQHTIKITLNSIAAAPEKINKTVNYTTVATPFVHSGEGKLSWDKVADAVSYIIIKNGKKFSTSTDNSFAVPANGYAEFQVIALDKNGVQSFASEPVVVASEKLITTYEIENNNPKSDLNYQGFSGTGFTEINIAVNKIVKIAIKVVEPGLYAIDFKYANGNGPTNTENKCAIRALSLDGKVAGTSVFPQRGKNEWSNWGYSNPVQVQLNKGDHTVTLRLEDHNDNMNGDINQAMLDNMRVIKLK
jgi:Bacterial alpha-L-rhamnosidase 6 hairpin glycosidase domain